MTRNHRTSVKPERQALAIRYRLRHSPHSAFAATRPGSMQKILEPTPAVDRLETRPKPFHVLIIAVAALAALAFLTASPSAAPMQSQRANSSCSGDRAVTSACQLITRFFDALNSGRGATACSFLGVRLLVESGGPSCPNVMAPNQGTPFKVISGRTDRASVLVRVEVGMRELDHWRMLNWRAVVGRESGQLKILDTDRVN